MNEMMNERFARVMDDPKTEKYCFADQIEFILYAKHCKDAGKKNGIVWTADSSYQDLYMRGFNLFPKPLFLARERGLKNFSQKPTKNFMFW